MKPLAARLKLPALFALLLVAFAGCESTDSGGGGSGSAYYESGIDDPWYYGIYHDDADVIVTPPENKPDRPTSPPRPSHPIALPPSPSPTPMPSIPSMPRVSGRR